MKIEKNIPMPPLTGRGAPVLYPELRVMEVGDSVFLSGENSDGKFAMAARRFGSRSNKKFTARAEGGGVRVWRVE